MDNHNQQAPDPEKFWPDAEQLLDKHFQLKRRKRLIALAFIAGLVLVGSTYLLISDKAAVIVTEKTATTNSQTTTSQIHKSENQVANHTASLSASEAINQSSIKEKTLADIGKASETKPTATKSSDKKTLLLLHNPTGSTSETKQKANLDHDNLAKSEKTESSFVNPEFSSSNVSSSKTLVLDNGVEIFSGIESNQFENSDSKKSVQYITGIYPFNFAQTNNSLYLNAPFTLNPEFKKPTTKGLAIGVYFTFQNISKNITAEGNSEYVQRRSKEEKNIIAPGIGINAIMSRNNFSYGMGIEYSYLGEKTSYDAYSKQTQYTQTGSWQTYTHIVTDIDTAYISGLQWFLETQVSQTDSTYETRIDTGFINKHDPSISNRNSVNKIQYLEIPLVLSYNLPANKFIFGVSGGISPVFILSQSGHYLKKDLSGVESLKENEPFNTLLLNGRIGLTIKYLLNPRIQIFCSPQWKTNLTGIVKTNQGYSQKYSAWGLQFGAAYNLY